MNQVLHLSVALGGNALLAFPVVLTMALEVDCVPDEGYRVHYCMFQCLELRQHG